MFYDSQEKIYNLDCKYADVEALDEVILNSEDFNPEGIHLECNRINGFKLIASLLLTIRHNCPKVPFYLTVKQGKVFNKRVPCGSKVKYTDDDSMMDIMDSWWSNLEGAWDITGDGENNYRFVALND
jgi:hypothetical protein